MEDKKDLKSELKKVIKPQGEDIYSGEDLYFLKTVGEVAREFQDKYNGVTNLDETNKKNNILIKK